MSGNSTKRKSYEVYVQDLQRSVHVLKETVMRLKRNAALLDCPCAHRTGLSRCSICGGTGYYMNARMRAALRTRDRHMKQLVETFARPPWYKRLWARMFCTCEKCGEWRTGGR